MCVGVAELAFICGYEANTDVVVGCWCAIDYGCAFSGAW